MKTKKTRWQMKAAAAISILLAAFFYVGGALASPDQLTYQSALVWRSDGTGDFIIPELATAGIYEIDSAYTADGMIENITASWQFQGKVTLEVSADDGLHYYPLVNGLPIKSGFIQGNQLKWRASLAEDSQLEEVRIAYTDMVGVKGTFGQPRLSGFSLRKPLFINNSGDELFNYQVQIAVAESAGAPSYDIHCDSLIRADFADVRFTATDGETLLSHYLEKIEGAYPNRVATFWVKVPQIPQGVWKIYLYYSNPDSENLSSAEAVFDFFDDFDQGDLDLTKWDLAQGLYTLSDSQVKLENAEILSKDYLIKDGIIELRAQADIGNEVRVILRKDKTDLLDTSSQIGYSSSYEGAEHCLAVGDIVKVNQEEAITPQGSYDYRVMLEAGKLTFQRYSQGFSELEAEATYDDAGGLTKGSIGLKAGTGCTNFFDWIRVRRYSADVSIDQETTQAQAAETVKLPEFSGTDLDTKGNLLLAEGQDQGSYISVAYALADEARIFVPSLKTEDTQKGKLDLAVSFDGGLNYAEKLTAEKYYYASDEDFTSGSNLQFKLAFSRTHGAGVQVEQVSMDCGAGAIILASPNGGETWQQGTQQEITWTAQEYEPEYKFKLEYSLNEGQTYQAISEKTENDGSYLWPIPMHTPGVYTDRAMVRISDAQEPEVYDVSDDVFSIAEKVAEEEQEEAEELEEIEEEPAEELDLEELLEEGERPGTQLYDVVIKLNERRHPDPEEDAQGRFKYGDILLVKPVGHIWSETERNSYLIIQVYLTEKEARELTRPKTISAVDESGQPTEKIVKARAKRLDLNKLGLAKEMLRRPEKEQKLHTIRNLLKDKALPEDVIEEK